MSDQNGTLNSQIHSSEQDEDDEEIELEKLEAEVHQMADKILQYRATLPDQLKTTLASILASQRPTISARFEDGSDPGPSVEPNLVDEENQETSEKLELLKRKISSNASAMPIVLKRMKECISRIDKLDSLKGTIHPAFKRKRTS